MQYHSIFLLKNNYDPQVFLEKCKHAVKKKTILRKINGELNLDEADDQSNNDNSEKSDED